MIKKHHFTTLFVVYFSILCFFPVSAHAATVQERLMSGSKFVKEKKYQEAVREFEAAVELEPKNPDANLLLGLTLVNTGDLARAAEYNSVAVQLKPSYSGYYNLGLIYANQEKYGQAIGSYESALKLNPQSYQAWQQLGLVYTAALKFDKAIEAYNKVIELNPKFASAYQGLGSAYFWSGDVSAAYEQVARLRELQLVSKAQELELWIKDKETKKAQKTPETNKL